MRLTTSGTLVAVVHYEARPANQTRAAQPEQYCAYLSYDFNSYPARIVVSAAQAAELGASSNFGRSVTFDAVQKAGGIEAIGYEFDEAPVGASANGS